MSDSAKRDAATPSAPHCSRPRAGEILNRKRRMTRSTIRLIHEEQGVPPRPSFKAVRSSEPRVAEGNSERIGLPKGDVSGAVHCSCATGPRNQPRRVKSQDRGDNSALLREKAQGGELDDKDRAGSAYEMADEGASARRRDDAKRFSDVPVLRDFPQDVLQVESTLRRARGSRSMRPVPGEFRPICNDIMRSRLRPRRFIAFYASTASIVCRPTRSIDPTDSAGSVTKSASPATDCRST